MAFVTANLGIAMDMDMNRDTRSSGAACFAVAAHIDVQQD
jgi:hypothetical protein